MRQIQPTVAPEKAPNSRNYVPSGFVAHHILPSKDLRSLPSKRHDKQYTKGASVYWIQRESTPEINCIAAREHVGNVFAMHMVDLLLIILSQ